MKPIKKYIYKIVDPAYLNKIRKSKVGEINHACEFETSLMLYFTDLVDISKTEKIF